MKKQTLIDALKRDRDVSRKMAAIRELKNYLEDVDVVRALCFVSLETSSHELRASIIDVLRSLGETVNPYFAHMAMNAKCANLRKWALVNLSLMECRSAKTAVIRGLHDSSGIVQQAAALNIGLYHDYEFIKEVERFFERNTFHSFAYNHPAQENSSTESDSYRRNFLQR